jgi:hypothetical protein
MDTSASSSTPRLWRFSERAYLEPASQTVADILRRSDVAELADRAFVSTSTRA